MTVTLLYSSSATSFAFGTFGRFRLLLWSILLLVVTTTTTSFLSLFSFLGFYKAIQPRFLP